MKGLMEILLVLVGIWCIYTCIRGMICQFALRRFVKRHQLDEIYNTGSPGYDEIMARKDEIAVQARNLFRQWGYYCVKFLAAIFAAGIAIGIYNFFWPQIEP